MSVSHGYTHELVRLARTTSYDDLPASTVHATKRLILDTIGCMIGGMTVPSSQIIAKLMEGFGGREESTVLGSGAMLPSPSAAYINGHAANALDAEETTFMSGHLSGPLVASALALAERQKCSGQELIASIAIGYEVAARIGQAVQQNMAVDAEGQIRMSPVHGHSWTAFGGTAACAHLLDLTLGKTLHAFGLTGSTAPLPCSGHYITQPLPRPMSKYAMYGTFANLAVLASLLAEGGFTSDTAILDGDNGFWRMTGSMRCYFNKLTENWAQTWLVEDASFKLYPCCRFAHPILDIAFDLQARHGLKAEEIERIEIEIPAPAISLQMHERGTQTPVDAQFDVAYAVATALIGEVPVGPQWFSPEARASVKTASLADKIKVSPSPGSNAMAVEQIRAIGRPIRFPYRVEIRARQHSYADERQTAYGDPWAGQAYDDQTLRMKFHSYTRSALEESEADAFLDRLFSLETHETFGLALPHLKV